jgi:mannan endo-1,4-beta-mannosidase
MRPKFGYLVGIVLLALAAAAQPSAAHTASGAQAASFVRRTGNVLRLDNQQFRFAGSNNYYLMYKSQFMVDDVLSAAAGNNLRVMRIWGSLDIGNQDGSNSIRGKSEGVYFQYWDGTAPAYNDGDDGLKRLDYVIYKAGQLGLKLVIPFVNNWNDFGGMDQYVRWRDSSTPDDQVWYHDSFYTDAVIRQWYKNWIAHLLNRVNIYTGVAYKNDPTIMTWELGNEPRCLSAGAYPRSQSCTTQTLIAWADEMSTYIKSIDDKHLVSVGDEGFYCIPGAIDWTENCGEGVDTVAFTALENIDVMSFHLYPDGWGKNVAWGTQWIQRHFQDAKALDKPAMLGEFGLLDKSMRNPNYKQWTDTVLNSGGAGALYWILSGKQDDGSLYPDYDGFTVYCPTPVCTTLSNFGAMMAANRPLIFAPVADVDTAVTEFNTPATLNPPANDIAYGGANLVPGTLDLDPAAAGQQTTLAVAGGTFVAEPNGNVTFTPTAGFSGKAQASYVIRDSAGGTSNAAALSVTVKPDPTAAILLASFESDTEGWASANWQANAGAVEQSTDYASEGTHSLKVVTADGGWFGVQYDPVINLSSKSHLKFDIKTLGAGTSANAAIQVGANWDWCQGTWGWINPGTTSTLDIDLLNLGCTSPDLSQVHTIYVWFSGGGAFYLDNVRAE